MDTLYIGVNATNHDSSVFVVIPGEKRVIALPTERVTRIKHDRLFFFPALEKALKNGNVNRDAIKKIYLAHTFLHRKDEKHWKHAYEAALAERKHFKLRYTGDLGKLRKKKQETGMLAQAIELMKDKPGRFYLAHRLKNALHINPKVSLDSIIRAELRKNFPNAEVEIDYFDHQVCHSTSAYFSSSFENALLFSYDGWGDDLFSRISEVKNGVFNEIAKSVCPYITVSRTSYPFIILGSPAGIYAYVTGLLGFTPTSEEGKVEALAAFAKPNLELYNIFMSLFSIDTKTHALVCDQKKAEELISQEKMRPFIRDFKREEIAASVQKFLDDVTTKYLTHIFTITNERNLCLSGGAAANVIMNLKIFETLTPTMHITPAMADDGAAEGAVIQSMLKHGYSVKDLAWLKGERMPYYGTSYTKEEVRQAAKDYGAQIQVEDLGDSWPEKAGELLADGKIGAIFHGRMEWGPRALGNRSIIADPRRPDFREKINKEIKRRPSFQPFCPSILAEEAPRLFEKYYLNKHMTCAFRMKKEFWDKLPSAIHIDGTARAQFVTEKDNPNYYRLLKKVKELTGFGVIINTSFNKHGRTIVETPKDAIRDFLDTDMDYVIIEGLLLKRSMKMQRLENYTRGWVVGDFDPVVLRSKDFEVMVRSYKKGEIDAGHVHKVADEITVVVSGKHSMNGRTLVSGDIIHLEPGAIMEYFECLEDGTLVAIKRPSVKGDKYLL
jgi:carbamoyltransferase